MRPVKLLQYRSKCIGCGICQELQPRYWRMSRKDGKAVLLGSVLKGAVHQITIFDERDESRMVAKACPNGVIKVV